MGGSSKKQTVGYRYRMGLHFALCYGPVDALLKLLCGDRQAWAGRVTANAQVNVNAPQLFGGDEREGGVSGYLDVMMGGPAQGVNDYLDSKISGLLPSFRGVLSTVWRGGLIGSNNPYIKPWAWQVERILQGWYGGSCWYPETAPIGGGGWVYPYDNFCASLPLTHRWKLGVQTTLPGYEPDQGAGGVDLSLQSVAMPYADMVVQGTDSAGSIRFATGKAINATADTTLAQGGEPVTFLCWFAIDPGESGGWLFHSNNGAYQYSGFDIGVWADGSVRVQFGRNQFGTTITEYMRFVMNSSVTDNGAPHSIAIVLQPKSSMASALFTIYLDGSYVGGKLAPASADMAPLYDVLDYADIEVALDLCEREDGVMLDPVYPDGACDIGVAYNDPFDGRIDDIIAHRGPISAGIIAQLDAVGRTPAYKAGGTAMNPAHIVYQCLTDPDWGMGYPAADIDDASFRAAADVFFGESLGLCLLWNQQSSIWDFVQTVLDHAGAILAVDPSTGKFILRPIRGGYDVETLPVYGDGAICALESWQRVGYGDTVNEITVVYRDVATNKDASITVQDLANIQAQGAVVSQTRQYPGIPWAPLAARIAQRDLNAASVPLAKGRLRVNRSAWDRIPGDVIRINFPKLGLEDVVCRVLQVDTGAIDDGVIAIDIAEDVFGLPDTTYSVQEPAEWSNPALDLEPSAITEWFAIEAPYWEIARSLSAADLGALDDATSTYAATVATAPGAASLGYQVWTYQSAATSPNEQTGEGGYCVSAALLADIGQQNTAVQIAAVTLPSEVAVGADIDLLGLIRSASTSAAVLGEWVRITRVELIDPGDVSAGYEVTVERGCLDTAPTEHLMTVERLWFVDGALGADETERAAGQDYWLGVTDSATGGSLGAEFGSPTLFALAGRHGRPYPPGRVAPGEAGEAAVLWDAAIAGPFRVEWAHRDRTQQTATLIGYEETSIGPEPGTTYTVRYYSPAAATSPLATQSGIAVAYSDLYSFPADATVRVSVEATRDGLTSWTAAEATFAYTRAGTIHDDAHAGIADTDGDANYLSEE